MKARKKAQQEWLFWRPVINNILTYTEACECDFETLLEANGAVSIKLEEENERYKRMFGKG